MTADIFSLATCDLGCYHQLKLQFDSSVVRYPLRVIPLDSFQYYYHFSNKQVPFITIANDKINDTIFSIILQIRKKHNRADVDSIHKQIKKTVDFKNITKEFLNDRIHTLITVGKIRSKKICNTDSYYVKGKDIDPESFNLQNTYPIIPDKSFYAPTISIPIPSTEKPLISPNETPITTKSTNCHLIITKLNKTLVT